MKRTYLLLLVLSISFSAMNVNMYSLKNYTTSIISMMYDDDLEKGKDDDWDQIEIMILTSQGPRPKTAYADPMQVYKSLTQLKVVLSLDVKTNVKIADENGMPVYLRQYTPGGDPEMLIDIFGWNMGVYTITFTNSYGQAIATGDIELY